MHIKNMEAFMGLKMQCQTQAAVEIYGGNDDLSLHCLQLYIVKCSTSPCNSNTMLQVPRQISKCIHSHDYMTVKA